MYGRKISIFFTNAGCLRFGSSQNLLFSTYVPNAAKTRLILNRKENFFKRRKKEKSCNLLYASRWINKSLPVLLFFLGEKALLLRESYSILFSKDFAYQFSFPMIVCLCRWHRREIKLLFEHMPFWEISSISDGMDYSHSVVFLFAFKRDEPRRLQFFQKTFNWLNLRKRDPYIY